MVGGGNRHGRHGHRRTGDGQEGASARARLLRRGRRSPSTCTAIDEGGPSPRQGVGARRGRRARDEAQRGRLPASFSPSSSAEHPEARRRGSSSTSSPGRPRAGSTASTWRRRSRRTSPRTPCATSGSARRHGSAACSARGRSSASRCRGRPSCPGCSSAGSARHRCAATTWRGGSTTLCDGMDGEVAGTRSSVNSLMPRDHQLDLFVTITDFYGYDRQVPIFRPRFVHDHRHRHALTFSYRSDGPDDFSDNAGLGFAARTTSCFPAVFPPVSLSHFSQSVNAGVDTLKQRSFRVYELSGTRPEQTYFVDGGILDNKPFGWAIGTIVKRGPPSRRSTGGCSTSSRIPGRWRRSRPRGPADTLHAAARRADDVPRREPILDDLLGVVVHNERVRPDPRRDRDLLPVRRGGRRGLASARRRTSRPTPGARSSRSGPRRSTSGRSPRPGSPTRRTCG